MASRKILLATSENLILYRVMGKWWQGGKGGKGIIEKEKNNGNQN